MSTRSGIIRQRDLTRIVKGATAAGMNVRALRVDKEGSVVLFSTAEREEPRLTTSSNEWDEVLKT